MLRGSRFLFFLVATMLLAWYCADAGCEEESSPASGRQAAVGEQSIALGLQDVVAMALEGNLDIVVERYNPDIKDAELLSAHGAFDPTIGLEFSYSDAETPQTTREGLASSAGTTETVSKDLKLSLEGTLVTGTEYEMFFQREQSQFTQRNAIDIRNPSEYNLDLTFKLTQPLLKDFGFDANLAEIRVAAGEKNMSVEDFRKKVMEIVAGVQSAYWDIVAAIENLRVTERSLGLAQDLLKENRIRLEVGTMAPLEVVQAETGVAQREEGVIVARSLVENAEDNLKRLLNLPKDAEEWKMRIVPTDKPVIVEKEVDLLSQLKMAFEKRPDYKRSLMKIENAAINEQFARNQLLPSVDLNGEYQFRAVDSELHGAFDDIERGTSPSWLLGATAEYPIGNRAAKGGHRKAQLEKLQVEKESENLRLSIIVEVNKAVRGIETSLKLIEATGKGTELAQKSLEAERKKLEVGVSTSHDVLQFEEELTDAERREIVSRIGYRKALINLGVAAGTILEENNIVVHEDI